ncbi:MAG: hypothetical protein LV480_00580 [Methylacidiphilales bacterium]|nr:hypothetical protein [Candidatus Methylacidiphilales bacterium]
MINQISPVQTQTDLLPKINKGLIQARHIQARLKEDTDHSLLPDKGFLWSPLTAGPYLVPVTRWIE